jgi:hypothetical protein
LVRRPFLVVTIVVTNGAVFGCFWLLKRCEVEREGQTVSCCR